MNYIVNKIRNINGKWQVFALFFAVFGIIELLVAIFMSSYHKLVWFCFYTAISNFCIPWLPHEPAILLYGTLYPPWLVAFSGGIATCWVEFLNYQFLKWIMNLNSLKTVQEKHAYKKAERYFLKFPFLSLVFAGFTPVPFAPFRVFAVTSRYSFNKYLFSVFVGRTPRYYILAKTGAFIKLSIWTYGIVFIIILIIALVKKMTERKRKI